MNTTTLSIVNHWLNGKLSFLFFITRKFAVDCNESNFISHSNYSNIYWFILRVYPIYLFQCILWDRDPFILHVYTISPDSMKRRRNSCLIKVSAKTSFLGTLDITEPFKFYTKEMWFYLYFELIGVGIKFFGTIF